MKTPPEAYLKLGKTLPKKTLVINPKKQVPYEAFPILRKALESITQRLDDAVDTEFKEIIQSAKELDERSQEKRVDWQNICDIRSEIDMWLDRHAKNHKDYFEIIVGIAIQKIRLILLSKARRTLDESFSPEEQAICNTINIYTVAYNKLVQFAVMGYKWSSDIENQIIPPGISFDTFNSEFIAQFWRDPRKYFKFLRNATKKELEKNGISPHIREGIMKGESQRLNIFGEEAEPPSFIPESNSSISL